MQVGIIVNLKMRTCDLRMCSRLFIIITCQYKEIDTISFVDTWARNILEFKFAFNFLYWWRIYIITKAYSHKITSWKMDRYELNRTKKYTSFTTCRN